MLHPVWRTMVWSLPAHKHHAVIMLSHTHASTYTHCVSHSRQNSVAQRSLCLAQPQDYHTSKQFDCDSHFHTPKHDNNVSHLYS